MKRVTLQLAILAIIALPTAALGQGAAGMSALEAGEHVAVPAAALNFEPLEVPGFDSGIKLAVIHGNPMGESGDYTIRLSFPDGYRFPAHWHPRAEYLTVLNGTLLIAMGTDEDPAALKEYTPGAFLYFPPENVHYGGAEGETVIQLNGQAPFTINLANQGS